MTLRVMGVPTAAGAYGGGVMRGPRALRRAGFITGLSTAGVEALDDGDLPLVPFASDPEHPRQQNLDRVLGVAREVADRVAAVVGAGDVPVVVGGDCTITLGVVSGIQRTHVEAGLAYIDGDVDLSTPATTRSGILDAMGIATMLDLDDAPDALAAIGPERPLLVGHHLALMGYDDALDSPAAALLEERAVIRRPASRLRAAASQTTAEALAAMADRDGLIVHFDVDVIDSTELPLAQYPHFNEGLSFSAAMETLGRACSEPDVCAVVITETNPDNDATGAYLRRLADGLAASVGRIRSADRLA